MIKKNNTTYYMPSELAKMSGVPLSTIYYWCMHEVFNLLDTSQMMVDSKYYIDIEEFKEKHRKTYMEL